MAELKLDKPLEVEDVADVVEVEDAIQLADKEIINDKKKAELIPVNNQKALQFVGQLTSVEPGSPEFTKQLDNIYRVGESEIAKTSKITTKMLDRPMNDKASQSPQMKVAGTLGELRQQVTELDPARADLKGVKKMLKWLPGGNKIDEYFNRYASARDHLNAIEEALMNGQDLLRRDNAEIDEYRKQMWVNMGKLREYGLLLEDIEKVIEAKIEEADSIGNAELVKNLKSEALFAVRQRRTDVNTQIAVAVQGYLALDIVRKNNLELVRGVDRALSTTMSAIQTAVVVAQALGVQEAVLAQINGLNATTGNLLESTSARLRDRGAEIQKQASSEMIPQQQLANAFQNVFDAMDDIDNFRVAAADNFVQTINNLQTQINRAQPYMERANAVAENK